MGISRRHARRLLAAYRAQGAAALGHGNRGRRPHNAVPAAVASAVVRFATSRYPGANHTHLAELLWEHEGLEVSSSSVRRILAKAGIPSPRRRRPPEHRVRRERMPREGMLLQVDGSHHAWLEERGPRFALLLAVDDATGSAVHALFRPAEDARGYFLLLEEIVRRCGIPLALYSDRHGVFLAGPGGRRGLKASTQFARAMGELGIRQIFARSPQAKGRVERAAGTFQDRLVTELRHASASTIPEAQAVLERFLPRFNARFRVPAAQPEQAYRPLEPTLPLASILSFRNPRTVARDNTVKYRWRTLQLLPGPERTSYAGTRVEVVERPGGELSVQHVGETIPSRPAPPRAGMLREARSELALRPDHERIASGLGSGGAPRRLSAPPVAPSAVAAGNGAAVRPETNGKQLRALTPRQLARWKAIQQAQLQGLSMRATARLLGIARDTVHNYVHARRVGDEASVAGVLEEAPGEARVQRVGHGHGGREVVDDEVAGHSPEEGPGLLQALDHGVQLLAGGGPHKAVAGVAPDDDQRPHCAPAAALGVPDEAEAAEVHLRHLARRPVVHAHGRRQPVAPAAAPDETPAAWCRRPRSLVRRGAPGCASVAGGRSQASARSAPPRARAAPRSAPRPAAGRRGSASPARRAAPHSARDRPA